MKKSKMWIKKLNFFFENLKRIQKLKTKAQIEKGYNSPNRIWKVYELK